ncbi:MAG TPA: patatin-like phospholipase family protein [Ferruginibacter sp.]|nr:patatin-like phospholipase family protein [Ferruginibacter sp.]HRE64695.1 patatin-like phospholipase family protein [Ferruginibacter sp.]
MKKHLLFLLAVIPGFCFAQVNYTYKNLALEGGGVRGLAYAGVFTVLQQKGILQKIENVAGSSAGAIAGLMLAVGYNANEIDSLMFGLPVQQFNDGKGGALGKFKRVKRNYGIYKGEKFEEWLMEIVAFKTGNPLLSFEELHALKEKNIAYKDLYVTGTNLSRQQLQIFSVSQSPKMPIALAVRISAGIPFYFQPVALNNRFEKIETKDGASSINYFVDGGMLCNYPIGMFDSCNDPVNPLNCFDAKLNPQTLGIKLERPEQIDSLNNNSISIPPYDPQNLNEYFAAFSNLLIETLSRKYPNLENEKGRTIYVSYGNIESKPRRMKPEEKKLLYDNGVKAALAFFDSTNITTWFQKPSLE